MTVSTTHLGKVVDVSAGQPAPKPNDFSDDGFPFIRAGSLESLISGQSADDCEKIDAETARRYRMRLYPKDTILFAKSGMSAKIGRVYRMHQPAYVVNHLAALAPIGKYEPSYLAHWLRAHPPSKLIKDDAYPSIRTSEVSSLEVPDLHIDEQRRVAAILDKADAIRRKREEALALADDFLKSVFLEMFGDLSKNDREWPSEVLRNHIRHSNNGLSRRRKVSENVGQIVLRIQDIKANSIDFGQPNRIALDEKEMSRFSLERGDVLFVRVNGNPDYVGRCTVFRGYSEPVYHNDHIIRLRFDDEFDPEFLSFLFNLDMGRQLLSNAIKTSAGQYTISQDGINELRMPCPPTGLQQRFNKQVSVVTSQRRRLEAARQESIDLFASLSQRAFNGEL